MASPAKVAKFESENLEGFLHCVSSTKVSQRNVKYFNAVLQTGRDEFHKVVCFSPEKHCSFAQASKNNTAIKLSNVKRSISYADPDGFDILCNRSTSLEVVNLPFLPRAPPSTSKMNIAKVQPLGPRQTVGVLEAKVLAPGTCTKIVNVKGIDRELKEFHVGDGTGHTILTLWDGQITESDVLKSYRFTDLSTRDRDGKIFLSGTPSTTIAEIGSMEVSDFGELCEGERVSELLGTVTAIQIICKRRCQKCKAQQEEFPRKAAVHRCVGCKFMQKSSSYLPTYSGTLCLTTTGKDHALSVSNCAITAYLTEYNLCCLMNNVEEIEEHFINMAEFSVVFNEDDLITGIKQRPEKMDDSDGPGNSVAE